MDNEKYQRIEYLLQVMEETFGFDQDAAGTPMGDLEAAAADDEDAAKSEHTARDDGEPVQSGKSNELAAESEFGIFSREGKRINNMK